MFQDHIKHIARLVTILKTINHATLLLHSVASFKTSCWTSYSTLTMEAYDAWSSRCPHGTPHVAVSYAHDAWNNLESVLQCSSNNTLIRLPHRHEKRLLDHPGVQQTFKCLSAPMSLWNHWQVDRTACSINTYGQHPAVLDHYNFPVEPMPCALPTIPKCKTMTLT